MNKYTTPDFTHCALITIDVQRDTLDGQPLEIPGTSSALPRMRELVGAFRQIGARIVHIVRIYTTDGKNVDPCRREAVEDGALMLAEGTPGAEIAPGLLPNEEVRLDSDLLLSGEIQEVSENEAIIFKPRWGAFYRTPLESYLRSRKVNTLIFSGCNFPNCPRTSIYEASERDFRIVLAEDALSGLYPKGREELMNIGVLIMSTQDIIDSLST